MEFIDDTRMFAVLIKLTTSKHGVVYRETVVTYVCITRSNNYIVYVQFIRQRHDETHHSGAYHRNAFYENGRGGVVFRTEKKKRTFITSSRITGGGGTDKKFILRI